MTPAQRKMYFHGWNHTRRILRAMGLTPAQADAQRAAIHQLLGLPESSDDFTEQDAHRVLAHFRAIAATEPEPPRPTTKE